MINRQLYAAYRPMANEEAREPEAQKWAKAMVGDVIDETLRSGGSNSEPAVGGEVRTQHPAVFESMMPPINI